MKSQVHSTTLAGDGDKTALPLKTQEAVDIFYVKHGPCCAGCDWWRGLNSSVGECHKAAPLAGKERFAMLGIENPSLHLGAGQIMTRREHRCGDFKDEFNWSDLPPNYLRKIGWEAPTRTEPS